MPRHPFVVRIASSGAMAVAAAIAGASLVYPGCGGGSSAPTANTLTLTATDFAFAVEGEPTSGAVDIIMPNEGAYEHYALFMRIDEGHSAEELFETFATEGGPLDVPEWAEWMGGPSILSPGETAEIRADFEPGRYAFICPLTDPDGVPHFEKGMYSEITIDDDGEGADLPAAEIEISGEDDGSGGGYAFAGLPESVAAGEAWVEFQNNGSEPHEMIVARTSGDLTLEETLAALFAPAESSVDVEAAALGGPAPILPGARQQILIDFQPGRYLFICFVPNPDGVPHVALGMTAEVTVPP